MPTAICLQLPTQYISLALFFAFLSAGRRRLARIMIIAITKSNSMSVKIAGRTVRFMSTPCFTHKDILQFCIFTLTTFNVSLFRIAIFKLHQPEPLREMEARTEKRSICSNLLFFGIAFPCEVTGEQRLSG